MLAACYPAFTLTAIVVTANHYVVDALAGFVVLGLGYLTARAAGRAGRRPAGTSPEPA